MPKTTYPRTPAEVAAAVLDAIDTHPEAFDMTAWLSTPDGRSLAPETEPSCGTTMCGGGWVAHLTGWTLGPRRYAYKDGVDRLTEEVAAEALDLPDTALFHGTAEALLTRLREIAGR
ncbi:hypothetical protein QF035_011245 [Streptomyces umbrinus]|uniref:Uncharacterized protein n=1 Tax=Streptomyces umbrinus TaxID=67370 RepID=A0ABU0TCM8_9ACTN|nr:hypothetical protein [Streptomyces umbrinus]MDQ1033576.1 hypothetical protein [Streptomyces umbrinus]